MLFEPDPFFDTSAKVRALYRRLAVAVRTIGPFDEKPTKATMNLQRGAVFLLVQPQLKGLRVTVKSEAPIRHPRILRTSHMTRTRWHNDFKLALDDEIDSDVIAWIRQSYELSELGSQPMKARRKPAQPVEPKSTVPKAPKRRRG